ncbi:MAG: acetate kinase [Ruminococcaceae bacterium]|nr:acetate kinase [Oscillospiraceae bacterium]
MKILVINAGSSSLKYQLFDMESGKVLAKGVCEKIGLSGIITHKRPGAEPYKTEHPMPSHNEALALVLQLLTDEKLGVIASTDEIAAIGHRFAHGGKFDSSRVLDDEAIAYLESIVPLNPLHGPPALKGVAACKALMANKPQVGVFDTSFYSGFEKKVYMYPLPYEWYEKYGIRRYGFHGTSHRFVSREAAEWLGLDYENCKIISCHIGSGSSITAIKNGKAIDTTMGFTPQEGVPMGTRCGSIDPSIIPYMMKQTGMTPDEIDNVMNKQSGLLGLSGVSSDAREIWDAVEAGNERAKLSMEVLTYRIKKIIGSYAAALNGVDLIVFTAGLGEYDRDVRRMACEEMEYLGVEFDAEINATCPRGERTVLTKPNSRVKVVILPTDEEYMIAGDTYKLVK